MEWDSTSLYNKSKLYAGRAHDEAVDSALFGLWMSLALELLARAALSHIHPVLLADPREQDNIHFAFGINPAKPPKSIPAKALFARCSVLVPGFTDKMAGHCLIVSERRNSELHSGVAAFENIDNAKWLPATYEVTEVLLNHLKRDFEDFLAEHAVVAIETLKNRMDHIRQDVLRKLGEAKSGYGGLSDEHRASAGEGAMTTTTAWLKENRLRVKTDCPACKNPAVISGEVVGRSAARIGDDDISITREIRILPNKLSCAYCGLQLASFQELKEAERATIYSVKEDEDPIKFFGIIPEELVDLDEMMRQYAEEEYGYTNE